MHPRPAYSARPLPGPGIVRLSRRTLIVAGTLAAVTLSWAGAATWFILSRDELAQRVFVRETEMRYSYEDRIAGLATRLEREVTGNLAERRTYDARLGALAARQAEIETRQDWLRRAAEAAGLGTALPASPMAPGAPAWRSSSTPKPTVAAESDGKPVPLTDEPTLRLREESRPAEPPRDRLSTLERALERTAAEELALAKAYTVAARTRLARLRNALDATGLDLASVPATTSAGRSGGTGGPLVSLDAAPKAGPLGFLLADLGAALSEIARLDRAARTLPLARPVAGDLDQTSGFGTRIDPFTRAPALHTGLDFRAEAGTPARATGSGRVVAAEWTGGYGNMVEIDHGNGVVTRYGHLSAFAVSPGDTVEAGRIIGLTGSTGRSTGPHLHYETRVGGEPVNPMRFLEAGRLLTARNG